MDAGRGPAHRHPYNATPMTDYYQQQADVYDRRTFSVDPVSFLQPLIGLMAPGSRILDVGCGSGRDLLWLRRRGFVMTGFERAEALAALAETRSGCPVIRGDFESHDFSRMSFDGLLLVAALVHVPHADLERVLKRILRCLRPYGVVLLSLKKGEGSVSDGTGRRFYRWQPATLDPILRQAGLIPSMLMENASALGSQETWLTFYLRCI